jgi:D-alanine transaminase/branched-chain amino acid aminotransferase
MQPRFAYLNGRIVPVDEAAISPMDIGLLRGYAVFDLLRTVHGRPFLLDEHLQRLRASADQLHLRVPASDEQIAEAIDELLARNGHEEATVRLVLTGGVSADGMTYDPSTPTFMILTHELREPPASLFETGGRLLLHEHRREVPLAKTTNYITLLRHRRELDEAGALDLLYHDGEQVFEAASASVYVIRNGEILAQQSDVLWGTIGSLVLKLAKDRFPVVFREVTLAEAIDADEAFLTSTTRGIIPIVQLGEHAVGTGEVGPITRELMAAYRAAVFG